MTGHYWCRPDDRRGRPVSSKSESFKARRRSHPCSSSNARDVERSRFAAICVFRSATLGSAVPIAPKPTLPGHIVSLSRRLIDEVKDLRRQAAATAAAPSEISASGLADRGERRRRMSKAHSRFTTTTPATPPASLICPLCDRPLAMTEAMSAASAIVSQNNGITTCAPLAALSSIVSAPANSIAWTRCLDGQTEE